MKKTSYKSEKIGVKGKGEIQYYRPCAVVGLNTKQVRDLKKGKTIKIDKSAYNKNKHILEEVKTHGNDDLYK